MRNRSSMIFLLDFQRAHCQAQQWPFSLWCKGQEESRDSYAADLEDGVFPSIILSSFKRVQLIFAKVFTIKQYLFPQYHLKRTIENGRLGVSSSFPFINTSIGTISMHKTSFIGVEETR